MKKVLLICMGLLMATAVQAESSRCNEALKEANRGDEPAMQRAWQSLALGWCDSNYPRTIQPKEERDLVEAYKWFLLTLGKDDSEVAEKWRGMFEFDLSSSQIEEAKRRAKTFKPKQSQVTPSGTQKKLSPTSSQTDIKSRLLKLKELEEEGLISKEQADKKRKKVLDEL